MELPLALRFSANLKERLDIFVSAGSYLGIALHATSKIRKKEEEIETIETIKPEWGNDESLEQLRRVFFSNNENTRVLNGILGFFFVTYRWE